MSLAVRMPVMKDSSFSVGWSGRLSHNRRAVCLLRLLMTEASTSPTAARVVVASHLVPIHLERSSDGTWTAQWDEEINKFETAISRYTALGVRSLMSDCLFIGSPQIFVPRGERDAAQAAIDAAGINCVLVHLEPSVASRFYQGFCKSTLWPLLHNVLDVYNNSAMGAIIDRDREPRPLGSPSPPRHGTPEPTTWRECPEQSNTPAPLAFRSSLALDPCACV